MENKSIIMKAYCSGCSGTRNHKVLHEVEKNESEELNLHYDISWGDRFYLLECCGCENIKTLKKSWFSEDTGPDGTPVIRSTYYPPSIFRPLPKWVSSLDYDWHITKLIKEIYQAIQNDSPSLSVMGIRAVIEAIMIDKIGDNGTFNSNLRRFQEKGFIAEYQMKNLEKILELGHASIHRAYIPENNQIEVAVDLLENLVHGLYVLEHQTSNATKDLPQRQNKKTPSK